MMRNWVMVLVVATFVSGCSTTGYSGKGGLEGHGQIRRGN
jgi:uncharacterized protein YceK